MLEILNMSSSFQKGAKETANNKDPDIQGDI